MIFVNIYFIFYPADLCTALHPMMKILVLVKQREWRTVLQPLVATEDRLVKDGKIKSLEEIYLYSLPIKEHEIIDLFIGPALKDEVLKIMPVQKQTRAGQRTRFNAFVGKFYAYFV